MKFKSFRSRNQFPKKEKEEEQKEEYNNSNIIYLKEEDEYNKGDQDNNNTLNSNSKDNENESEDCESINSSLDEERFTLGVIEKNIKKQRKIKLIEELKRKNEYFNGLIVYDKKKKKIEKAFCAKPQELNEFLIHCQVKKISIQDFSSNSIKSNNSSFDPIEWMKTNNIYQRTLNIEDLSIICNNKNQENKKNNIKVENNNIKKDKEKKKSENFIELIPNFTDIKLRENYGELQKIISCKTLTKNQKNWINNFITKLGKIDIKDIKIEKDKEGKDQKLDIVFDLDNTIIFSFLSSEDNIFIQSKKNIIPKKDVNIISFNYKDIVIYTIFIIRKGFKEFIKYIEPLCTFHISTLGCENYGNEVRTILDEYSGVDFIRYKARNNNNEYSKKLDDLYLSNEKAVIFDDNVKVWKNKDNEHVINTKFFYDEECAMININERNKQNNNLDYKYNKDDFKKTYKFFYNGIDNNNLYDWKEQKINECNNIPFYQFKKSNDFSYNQCYTAEYLNSSKLQFIYMKNVIKEIYYLKFVYMIEIPLAIKLIRISTLANMKFDLKYLDLYQKIILTNIIKICGGNIFDGQNREKDEKIYLVASERTGFRYKEKIFKEIDDNPLFILINEKYILDTYYFMTNLIDNINDSEYTFSKLKNNK